MNRVFQIFLIISSIVFTSACSVTRVNQPVIVGAPGPVYRTMDGRFSVQIINQLQATLDLYAGQTLITRIQQGQAPVTLNLCGNGFLGLGGLITISTARSQQIERALTVMVLRPDGTHYGSETRNFYGSCDVNATQRVQVWEIDRVRPAQALREE